MKKKSDKHIAQDLTVVKTVRTMIEAGEDDFHIAKAMRKIYGNGDMLSDLFERQEELSLTLGDDFTKMTLEEREEYTKDKVLALLDETHEVLREINWKSWKKTKKEIDKDHLLEELADTFHFYINLCLVWGFNSENVYEAYLKKDKENYDRIKRVY